MIDMHCPANVTLIAGREDAGHTNGNGKQSRFRNPAGIAVTEDDYLYVCDAGNGVIRTLNLESLFCHALQIPQDLEERENDEEEENCATRRVRKIDVQDLILTTEANLPSLMSPFAVCTPATDKSKLFVSDIRLRKVFRISQVSHNQELKKTTGNLEEFISLPRSSLPTALALTHDGKCIFVGDCCEEGSKVHLYNVDGATKLRSVSEISSPMGIGITENSDVFISSSKEHGIYHCSEEKMRTGSGQPELRFGGVAQGHNDGLKSTWNMPTGIYTYRNTVFVCDTSNKAIRIITSATGLIPLQRAMANYANIFKLDKKENSRLTFAESLKCFEGVVSFFQQHEEYAFDRTGKRNTNGPDMTISRTTRQFFVIALESITNVVNTFSEIGKEDLLNLIDFESLTTLAVESFFKGMRADHDMPTVLQYRYKRTRCVQDNMMRIYQKHFSYFTCPNSFYPERIINSDPPDFGLRQTKQMATHEGNQELTKEDVEELKDFAREYGRGVRQDNVRSKTKELNGTLPYALSFRPTVIPTVDTNEDVVAACQEQELNLVTRSHPVVRVTAIYQKDDVIAVRHNRRSETCPFWLAVLAEDVHLDVNTSEFVKRTVQFTWLEQSEDHLTYTLGGLSLSNSPKCILARANNYTCDQTRNDCFLTLAPEEDNRLCRLANCDEFENDVSDHDDSQDSLVEQQKDNSTHPVPQYGPSRQAGVSLTGRRTTRFLLH